MFGPLLDAIAFLTILPAGRGRRPPGRAAAIFFPVAGAVLGALLESARRLAADRLDPLLAAAALSALGAALTRGMHLDGLADTLDGLLGGRDAESRLRIMDDPRVGAFGATGIALATALKTAAVYALPALAGPPGISPLALAPVLARWAILLPAALFRSPRPAGYAKGLLDAAGPWALLLAAPVPLAASGFLLGPGGLALAGIALAAALVPALAARRLLGGITGDVLGAGVEAAEIAVLAAAPFVV